MVPFSYAEEMHTAKQWEDGAGPSNRTLYDQECEGSSAPVMRDWKDRAERIRYREMMEIRLMITRYLGEELYRKSHDRDYLMPFTLPHIR